MVVRGTKALIGRWKIITTDRHRECDFQRSQQIITNTNRIDYSNYGLIRRKPTDPISPILLITSLGIQTTLLNHQNSRGPLQPLLWYLQRCEYPRKSGCGQTVYCRWRIQAKGCVWEYCLGNVDMESYKQLSEVEGMCALLAYCLDENAG